MYLSNKQIEWILERAELAYRHNALSKSKQQRFIGSLQAYLKKDAHGVIEDVCHQCLGSGKRKNEENT